MSSLLVRPFHLVPFRIRTSTEKWFPEVRFHHLFASHAIFAFTRLAAILRIALGSEQLPRSSRTNCFFIPLNRFFKQWISLDSPDRRSGNPKLNLKKENLPKKVSICRNTPVDSNRRSHYHTGIDVRVRRTNIAAGYIRTAWSHGSCNRCKKSIFRIS